MDYIKEELEVDWKMSQIEKRGLHFLLAGMDRAYFAIWLRKPEEYKEKIRNISSEQTQEEIELALKALISS